MPENQIPEGYDEAAVDAASAEVAAPSGEHPVENLTDFKIAEVDHDA